MQDETKAVDSTTQQIVQERKTFLDKLRSGASLGPTTEQAIPEEPPAFKFITSIPITQITSLDLYVFLFSHKNICKIVNQSSQEVD